MDGYGGYHFPIDSLPAGAWWRQSPCKEIRSVHIIWPLLRPEAIENQMMGDLNQQNVNDPNNVYLGVS